MPGETKQKSMKWHVALNTSSIDKFDVDSNSCDDMAFSVFAKTVLDPLNYKHFEIGSLTTLEVS